MYALAVFKSMTHISSLPELLVHICSTFSEVDKFFPIITESLNRRYNISVENSSTWKLLAFCFKSFHAYLMKNELPEALLSDCTSVYTPFVASNQVNLCKILEIQPPNSTSSTSINNNTMNTEKSPDKGKIQEQENVKRDTKLEKPTDVATIPETQPTDPSSEDLSEFFNIVQSVIDYTPLPFNTLTRKKYNHLTIIQHFQNSMSQKSLVEQYISNYTLC